MSAEEMDHPESILRCESLGADGRKENILKKGEQMNRPVLPCGHGKEEKCFPERVMNLPLLYRAALQGKFGKRMEFSRGSMTDALFVYLDGFPEPESTARISSHFRNRPLVCLTNAWEEQIRAQYPDAAIYRRTMMKPSRRFAISESIGVPEGYRLAVMDEAAFEEHPFSQGVNYPSWAAFQAEGSGAVVYHGMEIAAAASSFLSLNGEIELDVSVKEAHRGKKLAAACVARLLRDCTERGLTVHWDAQNDVSRHLAEKFGFETETEYPVYWLL